MFPPIENFVVFRASFPDGAYENVVPASEMTSGVRLMQLESVSRGLTSSAWRLTRPAIHAWESLYTGYVTATRTASDGKTVDMLKETHSPTMAGLPFTIIDGDGAEVYLVTS